MNESVFPVVAQVASWENGRPCSIDGYFQSASVSPRRRKMSRPPNSYCPVRDKRLVIPSCVATGREMIWGASRFLPTFRRYGTNSHGSRLRNQNHVFNTRIAGRSTGGTVIFLAQRRGGRRGGFVPKGQDVDNPRLQPGERRLPRSLSPQRGDTHRA